MARYFLQTSPGPLIILVRHGITQANEGGDPLIRAWKDYPLDEKREYQIRDTAEKLKAYKPGYIVSSDLMRDTSTAQIIADVLNMSNREVDFDARTWDMGTLEGQPLKEVNPIIEQLYKRPWEIPPGSSESFDDFSRRWQEFLDRKMYLAANVSQMRPLVIVTHGKNIALAYTYINLLPPVEGIMPYPAGYAVLKVGDDGGLTMDMVTKTEPVIEDM